MNPLLQEAAASVQLGWVLGVMTAFFLVFFLAWTWWAYSPKNKELMEEIGRMPLSDGGET